MNERLHLEFAAMKNLNSLIFLCIAVVVGSFGSVSLAQNKADLAEGEEVAENGIKFGQQKTAQWRVGISVTASKGPMKSVQATVPIPVAWPEQTIKLVKKEVSRGVRVSNRNLGGVRQVVVQMPGIANGKTAQALFTLEITRKEIVAPTDTDLFVVPKKVPRDVKRWLNSSPYIESRDSKIKALAREATQDVDGAWARVEAIYDTVREKIEYKEGKIKTAVRALKDGEGDCEELTSVFIAMCRSQKIPARMVWVPDHCYPEFYLAEEDGTGHWFPCQAAGTRAFGSMPEMRPILQKGDNFKVPEKNRPQRYVAEHVSATPVRGSKKPVVKFVREYVQPGG